MLILLLIVLLICFAVMTYVFGHAVRVWMRSYHQGSNSEAAAKLLDSGMLTPEERQKLRQLAKGLGQQME